MCLNSIPDACTPHPLSGIGPLCATAAKVTAVIISH